MSGDGTYAPKSPDLSSFDTAGPTPPAEPPAEPQQLFLSQQSQPNFSHLHMSSFSSTDADARFPSAHYQQAQSQRQYQLASPPQLFAQPRPTNKPNTSQAPGFNVGVGYSSTTQHEYHPPRAASYPTTGYSQPGVGYTATQAPSPHHQQQPPPFYNPPYRGSSQYQYQQQPQPPQQFPAQATISHATAARAQVRPHYDYPIPTGGGSEQQDNYQFDPMPPRRAAAAAAAAAVASQTASEAATGGSDASPAAAPAGIEASPVKTKFPTARIKRIMQADEEVGKVAQQTPIAVGKALELFMVALVTKSADVARQRNSKRVSAQMLKQVVESDDQWDFLRDIVAKVEGDEKGGKGGGGASQSRVKAESSETDEEMGGGSSSHAATASAGGDAAGGKRKRGGGRKKKV